MMRTGLAILVLVLLPGVLLDGVWLRGEVPYSAGILEGNDLPWYRMQPSGSARPENPLLSDMVYQFLPWDRVARRTWKGWFPPLWNPYGGAGVPLLANPQAGVLDPVRLAGLLLDARWAPVMHSWLKLALAGLFCFGFLRHLRAGWSASILGAMAFQLGGFMIPWLTHPHSSCALFFPAILWAGDVLLRTGGARPFCALAVTFCLQFLAGHPETSLHITILSVLFWSVRRGFCGFRHWMRVGLALCTGVLLASPLLLPFVEYMLNSANYLLRTTGPPEPVIPFVGAATFWMPGLFGWPLSGDWTGPMNANEVVAYIGVVPWLLAPLALLIPEHRRTAAAMSIVLVFSAGAAYGAPGLRDFLEWLPGFGWGANRRFILGVAFSGAVLSCLGLDALLRSSRPPGLMAWWGSMTMAAVSILMVGAAVMMSTNVPNGFWSSFRTGPGGWVFFLAQTLLVLLLLRMILTGRLRPWLAMMLIPVLLVDLGIRWRKYIPTAPASNVLATTPAIEALRTRVAAGDRVMVLPTRGREKLLPPNTLQAFGIAELGNFDVLEIPEFRSKYQKIMNHPSASRYRGPEANLFGSRFLATSVPLECIPSACRLFQGQEHELLFPVTEDVMQVELLSYLVEGEGYLQDTCVAELKVLGRVGESTDEVHTFQVRAGEETADWAIPQLGKNIAHRSVPLHRVFTVRDGDGRPYLRNVYRHRFPWHRKWGRVLGARICFKGNTGFLEVEGIGLVDRDGHSSLEPEQKPFFRGEIMLYENEHALPRAFLMPANKLSTTAPGPEIIRPGRLVEVQADCVVVEGVALKDEVLVLTDTWFPGWVAEVGAGPGQGGRAVPVTPAFSAFRAVEIPPGPFSVTFSYEPFSFVAGLIGFALGICSLLVSIAVRARNLHESPDITISEPTKLR